MNQITIIEFDGTKHHLDIEQDKTLMQLAIDNGIPGIDGDCGGECACGTCHVILDSVTASKLADAGDDEAQMLDITPEREDTSRLACQISLSADLDGLVARLPEFQM